MSSPEAPPKTRHLSDKEVVEIVAEDLRYLQEEWDQGIDEHSLRRDSPILRRLLVDGELQRVWKLVGFQREPQVTACALGPILDRAPSRDRVIFASAGGAHWRGGILSGVLMGAFSRTPEELAANKVPDEPTETLGLSRYVEANCIWLAGKYGVNRRELIKFVSERLGGAHVGAARLKPAQARLYDLLDQARKNFVVMDGSPVYFEFLSIGQALVAADDIEALRVAARGWTPHRS